MGSFHECSPVPAEQGIHETGFLSPPALAFVPRDCFELLLKPAPIDSPVDLIAARVDRGSSGLHGSRAHGPPRGILLSGPTFDKHSCELLEVIRHPVLPLFLQVLDSPVSRPPCLLEFVSGLGGLLGTLSLKYSDFSESLAESRLYTQ